MLGLFTRFFAAAIAIELGIAFLMVHMPNGFGVGKGGYEYVLFLGIVMFAIALRGGPLLGRSGDREGTLKTGGRRSTMSATPAASDR